MIFSIMTLSIMPPIIMTLSTDAHHDGLNCDTNVCIFYSYADCNHADCYHAECYHADERYYADCFHADLYHHAECCNTITVRCPIATFTTFQNIRAEKVL